MKPLLKNWLFRNNKLNIHLDNTALSIKGKGCIALLLLTGYVYDTLAQNLVPNPSFENYTVCPTNISQFSNVISWTDPGTSTDYFNSCASPQGAFYGIPAAFGGFQFPRSGNAFAGAYCYYLSSPTREYLQAALTDSLTINACYLVSFNVNLHNGSIWGLSNIAASFTNAPSMNPSLEVLNLPLHVSSFGNKCLNDTLSWSLIQGIYYATGGEKHILLGNFKDDSDSDTTRVNSNGWFNGSYYYFDDISVIPINNIPGGMPAFAGNDTSIAAGDSVFIGQEISNLYCNWYSGSTLVADSVSGLYVSPATTTTYTVEQNLCGIITYDTVIVFVSGVGINETDKDKSVKLFPNPATEEFTIQTLGFANDAVINITDLSGRKIYHEDLLLSNGSANFKLDISNGVYFVHITNSNNHETIIKKLVIQK